MNQKGLFSVFIASAAVIVFLFAINSHTQSSLADDSHLKIIAAKEAEAGAENHAGIIDKATEDLIQDNANSGGGECTEASVTITDAQLQSALDALDSDCTVSDVQRTGLTVSGEFVCVKSAGNAIARESRAFALAKSISGDAGNCIVTDA